MKEESIYIYIFFEVNKKPYHFLKTKLRKGKEFDEIWFHNLRITRPQLHIVSFITQPDVHVPNTTPIDSSTVQELHEKLWSARFYSTWFLCKTLACMQLASLKAKHNGVSFCRLEAHFSHVCMRRHTISGHTRKYFSIHDACCAACGVSQRIKRNSTTT